MQNSLSAARISTASGWPQASQLVPNSERDRDNRRNTTAALAICLSGRPGHCGLANYSTAIKHPIVSHSSMPPVHTMPGMRVRRRRPAYAKLLEDRTLALVYKFIITPFLSKYFSTVPRGTGPRVAVRSVCRDGIFIWDVSGMLSGMSIWDVYLFPVHACCQCMPVPRACQLDCRRGARAHLEAEENLLADGRHDDVHTELAEEREDGNAVGDHACAVPEQVLVLHGSCGASHPDKGERLQVVCVRVGDLYLLLQQRFDSLQVQDLDLQASAGVSLPL